MKDVQPAGDCDSTRPRRRRARTSSANPAVKASDRERRLARSVAQGDRKALQSLYEEYSNQLFTVAFRLTDSPDDARDLLHDVFCDLPKALGSFAGESALGPWLRSLVSNAALQHLRAERRRKRVAEAAMSDAPDADASPELAILNSIALEEALSSLTQESRSVVVLKVLGGFSHKEVAELLQITRSTSHRRLYMARKLLRAKLTKR